MRKILIIFWVVVVGFFALGIVKDQVIKSVVVMSVSGLTGARMEVQQLSVGVFKPAIRIKGLKLYNPAGFPNEAFLDLPEVSLDYDLGAIFKKKLHLPLLVVNLKELIVVKNKEGKLNVDSLKFVQKQQAEKPTKPSKETQTAKPAEMMPMQIDLVKLNLGRVIVKDYTQTENNEPFIAVTEIGVNDKTYKNITSPQQLVALVLTEAMKPAAIKGAGIYGAATVLGVAFLPAGIAGAFIGKDDAKAEYQVSYDKGYAAILDVLKQNGEIVKEDKGAGLIKAKVEGNDVSVKINQLAHAIEVTATARKFMMPKAEVAGGIIYKIDERLK